MEQKTQAALPTDEQIIDLFFGRDEQAITLTDEKYGKYLYTIAYNIIRNSLDCEECLNDTYLSAWNKIPPARPTLLQVFLSKITRGLAIDRHRKKTAAKRIPPELVGALGELDECIAPASDPESELLARRISAVLNGYLHSLPKTDAFVFICRYYYSDSVLHIADMLGVSKNTVYRRLQTLRQNLRIALEQEGLFS